ncbi:MAG: aldo/keto reductase, partial [Cyanobacteria bacterium]|nr:aldo/keto reductase [Cyanobacteriota bacterium]
LESCVLKLEDISQDIHFMSPSFLEDQLNRSLTNLGLETLDLMYLHNAGECQIPEVGLDGFLKRLESAFRFYEKARTENKIRYYGLATWNCFRVAPQVTQEYLSLEQVVKLAASVGGADHGFRYIQLPYNMALPEAMTLQNQMVQGEFCSTLEAAHKLGIGVFTSVPLMQGQLLHQVKVKFDGLEKPAQQCLQFVRSTPMVIAPLVGHKKKAHVEENLSVAKVAPLDQEAFESFFTTKAV